MRSEPCKVGYAGGDRMRLTGHQDPLRIRQVQHHERGGPRRSQRAPQRIRQRPPERRDQSGRAAGESDLKDCSGFAAVRFPTEPKRPQAAMRKERIIIGIVGRHVESFRSRMLLLISGSPVRARNGPPKTPWNSRLLSEVHYSPSNLLCHNCVSLIASPHPHGGESSGQSERAPNP